MPSVSLSLDPLRCSSVYRTGEQEEKPFFFFLSLFRVFFYSSVVGRVQSLFCLYPFFEPRVFFFSISAAWQINGSGKRRSPSGSWFIWSLCFSFRHHTFLYSPDVNNNALVAAHTKYCLQVGNGIAETTTSQSNLNRRVPAQSADGVPTKQNKNKLTCRRPASKEDEAVWVGRRNLVATRDSVGRFLLYRKSSETANWLRQPVFIKSPS